MLHNTCFINNGRNTSGGASLGGINKYNWTVELKLKMLHNTCFINNGRNEEDKK